MPAPQSGSPMTYMIDGKHIIVAVSGGSYLGYIAVFRIEPSAGRFRLPAG